MKRDKNAGRRENRAVFHTFDSPFESLSDETIDEVVRETGRMNRESLRRGIDRLQLIVKEYDPYYISAMLAAHGPVTYITKGDFVKSPASDTDPVTQVHVEFLLGIVTQTPQASLKKVVTPDNILYEVWTLLPELFRNFGLAGLENFPDYPKEEKAFAAIQEWMRMHTLAVRNWGTPEQVRRICLNLYRPLDGEFIQEFGYSASEVISVFSEVVKISEERLNTRREKFTKVIRQKSAERMFETFFRCFPELTDGTGERVPIKKEFGVDTEKARYILLSFLNYASVTEIYTIDVNTVSDRVGLRLETVQNVFKDFSIGNEVFECVEPLSLRVDNPVWERPLLQKGKDTIFAPVAQRFFHDPKRVLEGKVTNESFKKAISKRRARFLEHQIESLFRKYFPGAVVIPGVKFKSEGVLYETDLLVQIDSCLIVVEAKSNAVSSSALRGAPDRMKREVERIIEAPSRQSQRFVDLLRSSFEGGSSMNFVTDVSLLSTGSVKRIIRLSVTLDDFATLQSQVGELRAAGFCDGDVRIAPTMILSDLEIVFDILDEPALRIHYLARRGEVNSGLLSMAHEAEWLQFYLNTGFNVGDLEESEIKLIFPYGSELIDQHYQLKEHGIVRRKPRPRISKMWGHLLKQFRERSFEGWTEAACILLSCSLEEQDEIEAALKSMRRNVPKFFRDPDHRNTLVVIPRKQRSDAIAFLVLVDENYGRRREFMENASSLAFEEEHVTRCLVICKRVNSRTLPYDMIAVFYTDGGDVIRGC